MSLEDERSSIPSHQMSSSGCLPRLKREISAPFPRRFAAKVFDPSLSSARFAF
jgi:hypothetical protein